MNNVVIPARVGSWLAGQNQYAIFIEPDASQLGFRMPRQTVKVLPNPWACSFSGVMVDVSSRDTSTARLGETVSLPPGLGPVAMTGFEHRNGEICTSP